MRIASATFRSWSPARPAPGPGRRGDAAQRQREHRGAAAVHLDRGDRLPGQILDGPPDVDLERVVGLQVGLGGQSLAMQVASMAACLPEQLNRTRDSGSSDSLISRRAVGSPPGSDAGQRRFFRSARRCRGSRARPGRESPRPSGWRRRARAVRRPAAARAEHRRRLQRLVGRAGENGCVGDARRERNVPSAASATTVPRCRDSTNPDRITSASTGLAVTSPTDNCSKGVTRTLCPLRIPHLPILTR